MVFKKFKHISVTVTLLIAMLFTSSYSQLNSGDSFISVKTGLMNLDNYTQRNVTGIGMDIMVTNKIGIHYDILFGRKYFHGPAAPIGGGIVMGWMLGNSDNIAGPIVIGLLLSLIPEGVSYNMNLNPTLSLSPYISPLQFDFIREESQQTGIDSYIGGALGLRTNILLLDKQIRIAPFGEYKMHYHKNQNFGWYAGLSLGWNFNRQVDTITDFE